MKMKHFGLFLLAACLGLFVACSDDDKPAIDHAQALQGLYKGDLKVQLSESDPGVTIKKKVTLTTTSVDKVNMSIKDFSFEGITIGDIEIKDIPVTQISDGYKLGESTQTIKLAGLDNLEAEVTTNGTVKNDKLALTLSIKAGDLNITVTFGGDKIDPNSESKEAKITEITFDSQFVIEQPIIGESTDLTLYISDEAADEDLQEVVVTIEVSEKATVAPASGSKVDLSKGSVDFTVTAEDGTTTQKYTVKISKGKNIYGFEQEWIKGGGNFPHEEPVGWATCNGAINLLKQFGNPKYTGEYTVMPTDDKHSGKLAVKMVSRDTGGGVVMKAQVPKVTASTIFLGTFNAFAATSNVANATQFGIPFTKKPLKVKGYYKYTPGKDFYTHLEADPAGKDGMSVVATLFEITKDTDFLNGVQVYSEDARIVAKAKFTDDTEKTEFTPFDLELEYVKDYDPAKKYKFTVVFSSSKDGIIIDEDGKITHNGAIGSTLIVDDVEIISE